MDVNERKCPRGGSENGTAFRVAGRHRRTVRERKKMGRTGSGTPILPVLQVGIVFSNLRDTVLEPSSEDKTCGQSAALKQQEENNAVFKCFLKK